jgi:uncharacterized OB-fold protein
MTASKPVPHIDHWTRPFWDACEQRHLVMQKCRSTNQFWFPPGPVSPFTRTSEWDWAPLSGRGRVGSYVIMHQVYFESFVEELPYPIAQIELVEGPMMISNLVDVPLERIKIGLAVCVKFQSASGGRLVPVFAPA